MLTWTIGSGGLIGHAVDAAAEHPFTGRAVPWGDPDRALEVLSDDLGRFAEEARGDTWAIVWAAGSVTVSSSEEQAAGEAAFFTEFVGRVAAAPLSPSGAFLLISSAGGVHAGSPHPPFTDATPAHPIGAYGRAKLAQEEAAVRALGDIVPVVLARVSNVYGPGQNLAKLQGLVSRLALCSIRREPLNLFVPLGTVRDYVYVTDVASAVHDWLRTAVTDGAAASGVRIIASGQGTSVGQLVRTAQDVGHRRVPIAMGSHPSAGLQAPDLRFIPSPLPHGPTRRGTPLPVGMKSVFDDIHARLQAATA